jgi:hypothetical protein
MSLNKEKYAAIRNASKCLNSKVFNNGKKKFKNEW